MNKFLILTLLASCVAHGYAQSSGDTVAEDDAAVRENPQIEETSQVERIKVPAYIRQAANRIDLNGADWSALRRRFGSASDSAVSVVHIGDSHLQADFATAVIRQHMQARYGNAGRGLVVPFKMAGTNEPHDYAITSADGMVTSRLLKMPWPTEMTFTGIAVQPANAAPFTLRVSSREPFDRLTFFSSSPGLEVCGVDVQGLPVALDTCSRGKTLSIALPAAAVEAVVRLSASPGTAIGGVSLGRGDTGAAYHVIGNNGATYSTYIQTGSMGADVAALSPELIVVSLGTNEAFGRVSDATFRTDIETLVGDLRRHNPQAEILLVTPAECYRRRTVRRRGRRRRARTVYSVNPNIRRLRDVIVKYGRDNNIAVYDWYNVAGGAGSAAKWLADHNLGRDRIHLTAAGYRLQGQLTADALIRSLSPHSSHD